MPGGLQTSLEGAPKWYLENIEDQLKQAAKLAAEKYEAFRQLPEPQRKELEARQKILRELQQGPKEAFIPFSVTGDSEPIGLTPIELERVFRDDNFAKQLIRETTGLSRVSKADIENIRQRARETYEVNLSEIRKRESIPTTISKPPLPLSPTQSSSTTTSSSPSSPSSPSNPNAAKIAELTKYLHEIQHLPETIRKGATYKDFISNKMSPKNPLIYTVRSEGQHIGGAEISRTITELQKQIAELGGSPSVPSAPSVPSSPSPSSLPSTSGSSLSQTPVTGSDIFKRAGAEREIRKLLASHGRVAPMNERHKQATRMLEKSFDDDTLELAKEELLKAQKHRPFDVTADLVKKGLGNDEELIKVLREQAERNFLEKVAPKINLNFAQLGGFHSGARNKALMNAHEKMERDIREQIVKLKQVERDRYLHAAQILGNASKAAQESERTGAENLRTHALTKHALSHSNASALSQIAKAEQEQRQNELNVEAQEAEKARNHEWEQLQKRTSVTHGLPSAPTQSITGVHTPIQTPNMYNIGGGLLGALGGLTPQVQTKAKGGLVRKRYAEGGGVEAGDLGEDIRNIIREREHGYRRQLQEAQQNPLKTWMSQVGKSMLSNPRGNPLENLGKGTANTLEHLEASRERMNNLYDKINDTKLQQYQILAAFEQQKADRASKKEAAEATRDYRQSQLDLQLARLNQGQAHHDQKLALEMAKIDKKSDKKINPKEQEKLEAAEAEYHDLLEAKRLLEEGDPLYHPGTQILSGVRPNWTKNPDQAAFEQLASDMRGQTFKRFGYRNQAEFKNIKEIDPSLGKEQNLKIVDQRLRQVGHYIKKKEKEYGIDTGVFSKSELPDISRDKGRMIKMLDPNGSPLEVPESDVEEASKLGATIAK